MAEDGSREKIFNILIGVTGSVATIKLLELVKRLKLECAKKNHNSKNYSINIKVVVTQNSKHFLSDLTILKQEVDEVLDDSEEWSSWKKLDDPVLHIELRKWADVLLIAPLDANTMAKLATGICDNLLTCVVRAWDNSKPLIYCPAMNVHMYNHPITEEQLRKLDSFAYLRVDAVEKKLACGDIGMGGMASPETIVNYVLSKILQD